MFAYGQHFTQELFIKAMENTSTFQASANFFYADWRYTCTPGVPINEVSVQSLVDRDFVEPVKFPDDIVIGVPAKDYEINKHLGAWRRATPEELVYAYVLAIARDVANVKLKGKDQR